MTIHNDNFLEKLQPRQDKRAINLERRVISSEPTSQAGLDTTFDPYSSNSAHKLAMNREPFICNGRIVDAIAYCKMYKVQLDRGGPTIPCSQGMGASCEVVGVRELTGYVLGTQVIVMWQPHMPYGYILAAVPDWMVAANQAISDYVALGSNVGLNVDNVHYFPFNLNGNGGITDWSSGRPFDDIPIGAWGAVSDTGGMVFMDPGMAFMRMDEETGVFFFYDNQRGRLAGHNLQIRSAGYERDDNDDQDEYTNEEGWNHLLYERRGAFDRGTQYWTENSAKATQIDTPWYARYEPADDKQQAIFRLRAFRGYLGQGYMHSLQIMPESAKGLNKYPDKAKFPGVAQESISTDGLLTVRSAKAVIIAKRALIPQPKRVKFDEDTKGDDDTNYKANSEEGSGPSHKVKDIAYGGPHPSLVRSAAFLDLYAHAFNWRNLVAFHYHKKDWYMPDEQDYPFASTMASGNPTFSDLQMHQYLSVPSPIQLKVDSRYGMTNYYPTDSYLALLEDGCIELADGYGFELRTSGGSALMSVPGDFFLLTGRTCNIWAGWDAVVRANSCVDIAANWCDVRIKAEKQCYILGGNDDCGGVLIESRSPKVAFQTVALGCTEDGMDEIVGGIVLKASTSAIVTNSHEFHVHLSEDGDKGAITLNAGRKGDIVTLSEHYFRHLQKSAEDVFWKNDTANAEVVGEGLSADASEYFGANVSYLISCICEGTTAVQNTTARLSVTASDGIDSNPSIVPAGMGENTWIGNRGLVAQFSGAAFGAGDTWVITVTNEPEVCTVNEYWCDDAFINSKLRVNGDTYISGCLQVAVDVNVLGDVAANGDFGDLSDVSNIAQSETDLQSRKTALESWAQMARQDINDLTAKTEALKLDFFFRSTGQQFISDYAIFETKWQQSSRLVPSPVEQWDENEVTGVDAFPAQLSYPPPGKAAWKDESNYYQQPLNLFDEPSNLMKQRGTAYEDASYAAPAAVTLNGNLPVIRNP